MSKELWTLEWSAKQNAFHIQPIVRTLASNQERFLDNKPGDYLVLMVGSKETCQDMADNQRQKLESRKAA